jgi:hypothetical protein
MGDTSFDFGSNAPPDIDADGEVIFCMGRVKCVKCGKVHGVCNEIEAAEKEKDNMLSRAGAGTGAPAQAGGGKSQRSGYRYINEQDLSSTEKRIFRIIDVKENTEPLREGQKRFSDVVFKGAFRGETRLLGFKLNNPNLVIIQEELGLEENEYPGRELDLFLEMDEFTGRYWMRVEVKAPSEGTKKGKK